MLQDFRGQAVRINPGLRVARISDCRLQIGSWPDCLVVDELSAPDLALIDALREGISFEALHSESQILGVARERIHELLDALDPVLIQLEQQEHPLSGLAVDRLEPDARRWSAAYQSDGHSIVARRAQAAVTVTGLGRTGSAVAQALAAAGVGTLFLNDDGAVTAADVGPGAYRLTDIGMSRARATRRQIRNIDPTVQTHILPAAVPGGPRSVGFDNRVDLVVVLSRDRVPAAITAALMGRDQPHLPVVQRERDSLVGPLVVPGESACSACLEPPGHPGGEASSVHWATANFPDEGNGLLEASFDEVSQALTCAGLAAVQVLLYLDGRHQPSTWDALLRLRAGDGLVTRHAAPGNPHCTCRLTQQDSPAA